MGVGKAVLLLGPKLHSNKTQKNNHAEHYVFYSVSTNRANCCMMTINVHDLIVTSNIYMLLDEKPSHLFIANTHSKFENLFEEVGKALVQALACGAEHHKMRLSHCTQMIAEGKLLYQFC